MKYILGTVLTLALTSPVLAAEFYIVQEPSTKNCTIVSEKPTSSTTVVMGNGKVYTSRSQAETALKEVCTSSTTGSGSSTTITTTPR
jgi:hypothetical protein